MNLPFHRSAGGSQTSILISESLVGLMVAATRQKEGRSLYAISPSWRRKEKEGGGAKAPAVTGAAIVIAVCGSESLERLSHGVAVIARAAKSKADAVKTVRW
jgi:hypothetical protein